MFYAMTVKNIEDKAKVFENHELRIKFLEDSTAEMKSDIKETKNIATQTLILLQNKQDRK